MSDLNSNLQNYLDEISSASSTANVEDLRIKFLGKKGIISAELQKIGSIAPEERKSFGESVNKIKVQIAEALQSRKDNLESKELDEKLKSETIDITIPNRKRETGSIHPISEVIEEVCSILALQGFGVAEGPEIEDDFHNFSALNIPPFHPAREMQDTFYMNGEDDKENMVLRTHTSSVQIRHMMNNKPPIKIIAPGRVYRSDYDITHTPMFHQVEGLYIDKKIHMGHLKACILEFLQAFFEIDALPIRFRPSFFPFTEPSAEVDIGCSRKDGELIIGGKSDWLEILGCGMVHPNVLKNVGIDPNEYQGFAFGLGIERIAMLKYGAPDLRDFFDSDIRWLKHYGFNPVDIPTLLNGLSS